MNMKVDITLCVTPKMVTDAQNNEKKSVYRTSWDAF